ncbi:MAG TPA: aminoglycoside phosphotransferase family protein, partial [Chloroflexota bacterium]|nr:aminoglycoside phosphotransferase family protein [Chloroflexota bacterium]
MRDTATDVVNGDHQCLIHATSLEKIVRECLQDHRARVEQWQLRAITSSLGLATGGLYWISETAQVRTGRANWTVVLKIVRPPHGSRHAAAAQDPAHWAYWRREPLAYASGLLHDLPAGLVAPRCFGVEHKHSGVPEDWLWLEAVSDRSDGDWSHAQYVRTARLLGAFNGASLYQRSLPQYPWLGNGYLAQRIERSDADGGLPLLGDAATWRHEVVARWFPPDTGDRLAALWALRHALVHRLGQLPPVLRHGDSHRRNMLVPQRATQADNDERVAAIDWGTMGIGPLGADLTDLVLGRFAGESRVPTDSSRSTEPLYHAYLGGVQASGWHDDPHMVRLGYTGTAALVGISLLHWMLARALQSAEKTAAQGSAAVVSPQLAGWAALARYLV